MLSYSFLWDPLISITGTHSHRPSDAIQETGQALAVYQDVVIAVVLPVFFVLVFSMLLDLLLPGDLVQKKGRHVGTMVSAFLLSLCMVFGWVCVALMIKGFGGLEVTPKIPEWLVMIGAAVTLPLALVVVGTYVVAELAWLFDRKRDRVFGAYLTNIGYSVLAGTTGVFFVMLNLSASSKPIYGSHAPKLMAELLSQLGINIPQQGLHLSFPTGNYLVEISPLEIIIWVSLGYSILRAHRRLRDLPSTPTPSSPAHATR